MKKIQYILLTLSKLLANNDEEGWGNALFKLYDESLQYTDQNYDTYFLARIMRLYGGMGSFNDLALHKDKEHDEFYNLKHQLYKECVNLRTKNPNENEEQEDEKE